MPAGPGSRQFTIGGLMVAVMATALLMGIVMTPGLAPILGAVVIPSTIGSLAIFLGARRLVEIFYGHRCPRCGVRGLERRGLVSFGERFYLCPRCGIRCRRNFLGLQGMFFWRDASGPEYNAFYQKSRDDDPWNAPPDLEDADELGIFSKTHMNLVRSKRQRRPENPNGPGLG